MKGAAAARLAWCSVRHWRGVHVHGMVARVMQGAIASACGKWVTDSRPRANAALPPSDQVWVPPSLSSQQAAGQPATTRGTAGALVPVPRHYGIVPATRSVSAAVSVPRREQFGNV